MNHDNLLKNSILFQKKCFLFYFLCSILVNFVVTPAYSKGISTTELARYDFRIILNYLIMSENETILVNRDHSILPTIDLDGSLIKVCSIKDFNRRKVSETNCSPVGYVARNDRENPSLLITHLKSVNMCKYVKYLKKEKTRLTTEKKKDFNLEGHLNERIDFDFDSSCRSIRFFNVTI